MLPEFLHCMELNMMVRSGQVRSGQVRSGQVRSGQVRPARQWRARSRAQAQNARIITQLLFTCGKNRQMNLNVSSTPFHPKQLLSRTQYLCICNTLEALIPTYVVDGPHVEHLKDARTANVEPTDAQAKWQHALPNSNSFCMWCKTMYWRGYLQQNVWPVHSIDEEFRAKPHANQPPTAVPRLICIILYLFTCWHKPCFTICSADAISFSMCPERAACGPTGSTQLNSTQLNSTQLNPKTFVASPAQIHATIDLHNGGTPLFAQALPCGHVPHVAIFWGNMVLEQPLLASSCLNDQARFNESWHKSMVMNSSGRLVITRPDLYVFKVTSLIPHRPPTAAISKPAQFFQVLRTTGAPGVTPEIAISHMLTFVSLLGDAVFDGLRTTDAWKTYGVSQHLARIACPSKD